MSNKIKDKNVDFLFEAILNLQTMEECYDFFEDLCTVTEIKSISQRIVVAKMLREGKSYQEIAELVFLANNYPDLFDSNRFLYFE